MNERIRELVRQAVESVDIVTGNESLDDELAKMYIPDCFSEKFAQLIVREACLALWTEECHVSDLAFDEVKRAATRIKLHFGMDPREITGDMLDRSITWMQGQLADRGNR